MRDLQPAQPRPSGQCICAHRFDRHDPATGRCLVYRCGACPNGFAPKLDGNGKPKRKF